jgi:putative sigma-54 modulation protein
MEIQISGQNIEITPQIREMTHKKFNRIMKHANKITNFKVNFIVDKLQHIVEAVIHLPGNEIYARSESDNLDKSLKSVTEKLLRQINKHKEKQKDHHR